MSIIYDLVNTNYLQMKKSNVLFISQEILPYLPESQISKVSRYLPQGIQERNHEIRTFTPRFGCINERKNQLHEVIRLSGMNLIINDTDHPLIIKVTSIQSARMQIYFIDNDDYFSRKFVFTDKNDKFYEDNDERSIFFVRGVIETVKKLGWTPDIIHCQGWMTSLTPLYIKKAFRDNPLFANTKIIFSIYNEDIKDNFPKNFASKVMLEGIEKEDLQHLFKKQTYANLIKTAIDFSDGIIIGDQTIDPEVRQYLKSVDIPVLEYLPTDDSTYIDVYNEFYDTVLLNIPVLSN